MTGKKRAAIIAACVILGVAWGLTSVFLLGDHYLVSFYPEDLPLDLMPPGEYSTFGKLVFFPGWASAQLTTIDGVIYYAGPNTDMYNPLLYLCSIGISVTIVLVAAFVGRSIHLRVRKRHNDSQARSNWSSHHCGVRVGIILLSVALTSAVAAYAGSRPPPYTPEIRDWYDLHAVRHHLDSNYVLMNDLDATSAGYDLLAAGKANEGRGWEPIGTRTSSFVGSLDGRGYEIRDVFINCPGEGLTGLFGTVGELGIIQNLGVTSVTVTGSCCVGGLVGENHGIIRNSYVAGSVTTGRTCGRPLTDKDACGVVNVHGDDFGPGNGFITVVTPAPGETNVPRTKIGFAWNAESADYFDWALSRNADLSDPVEVRTVIVHSAYTFTGTLAYDTAYYWRVVAMKNGSPIATAVSTFRTYDTTVSARVGGLVGYNSGVVTNCYSTGAVAGSNCAGGLVGENSGTVMSSYSASSVTGEWFAGGLVGQNLGAVSNSYSIGMVTGDWVIGGLVGHICSGTVSNSFSVGYVAGHWSAGGLSGRTMLEAMLSNSFWDTETSGMNDSDGGIGMTTAQMQDLDSFSSAAWHMEAVAAGDTNAAYIWNIVDDQTYPFLSWQSVS